MTAGFPAAYLCIKAFSETDQTDDLKRMDIPTLASKVTMIKLRRLPMPGRFRGSSFRVRRSSNTRALPMDCAPRRIRLTKTRSPSSRLEVVGQASRPPGKFHGDLLTPVACSGQDQIGDLLWMRDERQVA